MFYYVKEKISESYELTQFGCLPFMVKTPLLQKYETSACKKYITQVYSSMQLTFAKNKGRMLLLYIVVSF